MSDPEKSGTTPNTDEMELSPEANAALAKARRSFGFAFGIMLLGFMAIGVAIVYRVMRDAPPPTVAAEVSIPAEAEVLSAISLDGTVQITYRAAGAVTLAIFEADTGELRQSVAIGTE